MRQAYSTHRPASSALDGVPPAACRTLAAEIFSGAQAIHGLAKDARNDYGLRLRLLRSSGALAEMRMHIGARLQVADPDSEDARDLRYALYDVCDAHSLFARAADVAVNQLGNGTRVQRPIGTRLW